MRWLREAGGFSECALPLRRTNMRPANTFVKRVNTRYCAAVLGHSQDVDDLWKSLKLGASSTTARASSAAAFASSSAALASSPVTQYRRVGGPLSASRCTGGYVGRLCVFPQAAERTKLSCHGASVVPQKCT